MTTITALSGTTHVSFFRISTSFFSMASPEGDARTRSDTLVGAVKRQCAELAAVLYLPSNAVFCGPRPWALQFRLLGSRQPRTNQDIAMGEPFPSPPPSDTPPEDRLHSGKEIAAYVKRDVTRVQRLPETEGIPGH